MRLRAFAPGKVNLCLFLGPVRADGLHEIVSLVESVSLADELVLGPAGPGTDADEVVCPGVTGPNLAGAALAAYRTATGWDAPPQRLEISKRVPVAAGMGGGSADAAAALRLAARAAAQPGGPALLALAAALGADVPAQLVPGLSLVRGAGEDVRHVADRAPHGVLVLPCAGSLRTPAVYAEADRLRLPRTSDELATRGRALAEALEAGDGLPRELLVNDLEPAARSLCPAIDETLAAAREAGADHVLVSGSGPTVVGLFWGVEGPGTAAAAAAGLGDRFPGAAAALPVAPGWADAEPASRRAA